MAIQKVNLNKIAGGIGEDWKVVDLADVNVGGAVVNWHRI